MKEKSGYLYWHIIGSVLFLAFPIILSPRPDELPLFSRPTYRDFMANCFMLSVFYLNYYLFIPRVYFKNKHLLYGVIIIIGFLVITFLPSLLLGHHFLGPEHPPALPGAGPGPRPVQVPEMSFPNQHPADNFSFLSQIKHSIFLYIGVVLFSILLRVRTKLLDTEILKNKAEIGNLKGQINPHFFFNTLNNIYALAIREKAKSTASSVLKLSDMMRYIVVETTDQLVRLEKEINYINDYIDLQRIRLTDSVNLLYKVTGESGDKMIAPMILIPFIENAFKHGVNPDQKSEILIHLTIREDSLHLLVENQKLNIDQEQHGRSGVGIENTKSRLELLYQFKYALSVQEDERKYRVKLELDLS